MSNIEAATILRRQLKHYDECFMEAEGAWKSEPRPIVGMLRWCKRVRDMFDAFNGTHSDVTGYIDESLALVPMLYGVDVLGHSELWSRRVNTRRGRFNVAVRKTTFKNHRD